MPKNLVEAFKLDLQNNFMVVMTKRSWTALCFRALCKVFMTEKFYDRSYPTLTSYIESRPKEEIIREIESYAVHPEIMLDNYEKISESASNGIIGKVFNEMINDAINETLDKHNVFDDDLRRKSVQYIHEQLKLGNFNFITGTKRDLVQMIFEDEKFNNQDRIKGVICRKIDMINANNSFKEHLKKQVSDETISREELERYRTITPEEIDEYFSLINGYGSNNGSGLSM